MKKTIEGRIGKGQGADSLSPPGSSPPTVFPVYNLTRSPSSGTIGTRGFSRVRPEFSVFAEGRSHERRSGSL